MVALIVILIVLSTSCSVCGQLALKHGMNAIASTPGDFLLRRMAMSPWVIGGLLIYGLSVFFWLLALSRLQVGYLYPFASLSYVGITIGSNLIFKEPISRRRIAGIVVIVLGVCVAGLNIHL